VNAIEYKTKLYESFGLQLITTGLLNLVEKEGYSPHEAFRLLEHVKQNTFHALSEIEREGK
jgi:hypothetical protein